MQSNTDNHVRPPLRIGILLDSGSQPYWVHQVICGLKNSTAVDITAVFLNTRPYPDDPEQSGNWNYLLYHYYKQFDKNKFLIQKDALQRRDIGELIAAYPLQNIELIYQNGKATFSSEDQQQIISRQLDVILFPREKDYWGEIPRLARYGLWAYQFGGNQPTAFWEVVEGIPMVSSGLYICADDSSGERQIYGSVAPGDDRSPARIKNHIHIKTGQFAIRKLEQLHFFGERALSPELCPIPAPVPPPKGTGIPKNPGMVLAFSRIMASFIKDAYKRKIYVDARWDMAFRFGGDRLDISRLHVITSPEDGFWADPFPWQYDGKHYIFFEEFLFAEGKGRLRVMEVKRDGTWNDPVTILEKDYHLSYPFLFEWEDELYMLPETLENETIEVYRCISFPHQWELHKVIMEDVQAVDATLLQKDGKWWMFASVAVEPECAWDEVSLFYADTPFGPWTPHPCNPVRSDVRSARPGGQLFERGGRLYRPAQDCSVRYGYALSINEIKRLDTEQYEEVEVERILPRTELQEMGIHTVNQAGDLIVFDRFASEAKSNRLP